MSERIGVWLVGARGSVATTTVAGCVALAGGLAPPTGLVTALPPFAGAPLPELGDLVFGGHDLVVTPLRKRAEALAGTGVLPAVLPDAVGDALEAADAAVRPGITADGEEDPTAAVRRVREDLTAFRVAHALAGVVVVNVATTEPRPDPGTWPVSSLYARAAIEEGWPFVDFTPSTGARVPALETLARERRVPLAGRDGKTGETLVKSALAAMFADRHLAVRSWSGTNLLGGGDGAALADPARADAKRAAKGLSIENILGPGVDGDVHIGHVADLGDWKTAWDLVSFEGFLGTRMRLQFTWEGADSALAAPLVLDLARLVRAAHVAGDTGPLAPLAFFFKDPHGTTEHRLDRQWATLCRWAGGLSGRGGNLPPAGQHGS